VYSAQSSFLYTVFIGTINGQWWNDKYAVLTVTTLHLTIPMTNLYGLTKREREREVIMMVMITTTSFVSLFSRPQSHWFLKKTNTCRSFSTTHNQSNPPLYGTMTEWPHLFQFSKQSHTYTQISTEGSLFLFASCPFHISFSIRINVHSVLSFSLLPWWKKWTIGEFSSTVHCMPFTAVQVFLVLPRSKDSPFRLLLRPSTSHLPREIRRLRVWSVPTRDS